MWNGHVFREIRHKCGGLLDIDRSTVELSNLSYAKVKLQGNGGGMIYDKLELYCWGKRIQVRLFPLNGRNSSSHGGRTGSGHEDLEEDDD